MTNKSISMAIIFLCTVLNAQINWEKKLLQMNNSLFRDIAYGSGIYVAVGPGGIIMTSPDAIVWNSHLSGKSWNINRIIYTANGFIAVSEEGGVLSSIDGKTWSNRTTGTYGLKSVAFGSNRYIAVGLERLLQVVLPLSQMMQEQLLPII